MVIHMSTEDTTLLQRTMNQYARDEGYRLVSVTPYEGVSYESSSSGDPSTILIVVMEREVAESRYTGGKTNPESRWR